MYWRDEMDLAIAELMILLGVFVLGFVSGYIVSEALRQEGEIP